jgi:serine/threonine-protein kinase
MPFARARYIITQICRALGAAHSKGIIHRDMKPENVFLVEREGRPDFVKILDFGIAKMSAMDEGGARLTRTGMIFGTPEYMSPEQARGDKPDHRVDIYAVGCILYELLTGDVPFHADTFMGVLTKHMFEPPQPPSTRLPNLMIGADIDAVTMKALSKDRDQRFQTMKELAVALAACGGAAEGSEAWGNEPSHVFMPEESAPGQRRLSSAAVPVAGATTQSAPVSDRPTRAQPKGRGLQIGLVLGLLGAVGAGAAALLWPKDQVKVVHDPVPVAPRPAPPRPPAPVPAAPAKPKIFKLTFTSQPSGADVMRGDELLGTTPATVELNESDKPVELVVRKKAYKDYKVEVTPDRDREFVFDLQKDRGHSSSSSSSGSSSSSVRPLPRLSGGSDTSEPAAAPPKPATPPKSNGKLRDLKDPFSQ